MLIIAISAFSQKSKKFVLSGPEIVFKDLTKIPYMFNSGEFCNKVDANTVDPLLLDRQNTYDFDSTYASEDFKKDAVIKRNELKKLGSYENMRKYSIIENPERYSEEDIKYTAFIETKLIDKPKSERQFFYGITCQIVNGDTLVLEKIKNSFDGATKWRIIVIEKYKPGIAFREYVNKLGLYDTLQSYIDETVNRWTTTLQFNQQLVKLNNEVSALNKKEKELYNAQMHAKRLKEQEAKRLKEQKEQEEREAYQEEQKRKQILGNLDFDFTDPIGKIKTKSFTNIFDAKVTYEYYINEYGYEVKHGKFTSTIIFQNSNYWTNSGYGYLYLTGNETITFYYRNGIPHGKVTYRSNVTSDTTFGNKRKINDSFNFEIYKGFITGNFKFEYKGITYKGKATNGILDYCEYETVDGFHGKLSSISKDPQYFSIPKINNGNRTFEFDTEIQLPTFIVSMPEFRFPLIGSND